MEVRFLSAKNYKDPNANNGDCILIDTGSELVIYDCGCEEHAERVLQYMEDHHYEKAKLILSHNDDDHFLGIPYLVEKNALSEVYALLLLKYKDDLLDIINDGRRTRDSIAARIEELYDNIKSLGGTNKDFVLKDIFQEKNVANGVMIPGPNKEYSLQAVAKAIKGDTSDIIDKETIVNAVSTQLSICFGLGRKLLLTGDSNFATIENAVKTHNCIQLPHHGKLEQAKSIFEIKDNQTIYYVSDNTGNSGGGSNDMMKSYYPGHAIYNTRDSDQICSDFTISLTDSMGKYY